MVKSTFYIEFSFENEDDSMYTYTFGFNFKMPIGSSVDDLIETLEYTDMLDILELQYGAHDWSSSPSDTMTGIGYFTYEVSSSMAEDLMNKWRKFFVLLFGEDNVTDVFNITHTYDGMSSTDEDVYNMIESKTNELTEG